MRLAHNATAAHSSSHNKKNKEDDEMKKRLPTRQSSASKPATAPFVESTTEDDRAFKLVKLKKYCELTGDTPMAVHNRRRRGHWIDGVHCRVLSGRRLWINPAEVNLWFLQSQK
jgi:hypothetical protein